MVNHQDIYLPQNDFIQTYTDSLSVSNLLDPVGLSWTQFNCLALEPYPKAPEGLPRARCCSHLRCSQGQRKERLRDKERRGPEGKWHLYGNEEGKGGETPKKTGIKGKLELAEAVSVTGLRIQMHVDRGGMRHKAVKYSSNATCQMDTYYVCEEEKGKDVGERGKR